MQELKVSTIQISNFKGLKDLVLDFGGKDVKISGENGLGKTSVIDAYCWCMLGKNSKGQTEGAKGFDIKPQQPNGEPVHHLKTYVEIVFTSGLKLRREYEENWTKTRGKADQELKGHTTTYFVDDVPCTQKAYNDKVAELCINSDLFTLLSKPSSFFGLKVEEQRALLVSMVSLPTIEDISTGNPEFIAMLRLIEGKDLAEFKKQKAYEKKNLKTDLAEFDPQIRGVESTRPTLPSDTRTQIEAQISEIKNKLQQAQATTDEGAMAEMKLRLSAVKETMSENARKLTDAVSVATNAVKEAENRKQKADQAIRLQEKDVEILKGKVSMKEKEIAIANDNQAKLDMELVLLRAEWFKLSNETYKPVNTGVCPLSGEACAKAMPSADKIEAERYAWEMQRQKDIAENGKTGKEKKERFEGEKARIVTLTGDIEALNQEISKYENNILTLRNDLKASEGDVTARQTDLDYATRQVDMYMKGTEYLNLKRECDTLEAQILSADKPQMSDEFIRLTDELHAKEAMIFAIDQSATIDKRIKELQERQKITAEKLAEVESQEFILDAMIHRQMDELEARVNNLFSDGVQWRMFEAQINGGETPSCTCLYKGVRYNDLNTASKVRVDLLLASALQKHNDISVPIFVDNAESVTLFPKTFAQTIYMYVDSNVKKLSLQQI